MFLDVGYQCLHDPVEQVEKGRSEDEKCKTDPDLPEHLSSKVRPEDPDNVQHYLCLNLNLEYPTLKPSRRSP